MWKYIFFIGFLDGTFCLSNVKLRIQPNLVKQGDTCVLKCERDLQGAQLYSVKWYRGPYEFYRYMPDDEPKFKSFNDTNFNVDMRKSNEFQVTLNKLDITAGGIYTCEVSQGSPPFTTKSDSTALQVVALPEKEPQLYSDKQFYQLDELMTVTCVSGLSKPAANLTMYMNNRPLTSYKTSLHNTEDGYQWLSISAKIRVQEKQFIGDKCQIRCHSSLYKFYYKSVEKYFYLAKSDPKPDRVTSAASITSQNKNNERMETIYHIVLYTIINCILINLYT